MENEYVNWYALNYPADARRSLLIVERFNHKGIQFDAAVMAGPLLTWEAEGDAVQKNRTAIGIGNHISCFELRQRLAANLPAKKPSESAIPWDEQQRAAC